MNISIHKSQQRALGKQVEMKINNIIEWIATGNVMKAGRLNKNFNKNERGNY